MWEISFEKIKTISIFEWVVCSLGMFVFGLGMAYIDVEIYDHGIPLVILGLILEIPAFYLIYKHK
jgi:hypothetical protein